MRISDQMMYQNIAQGIDQAQASYIRTQQEASSGLSISQPSDNPQGTALVLQLGTAQSQVQGWQSNAQQAQNKMQTTDQAMAELQNILSSASSLAVQGASSPVSGQNYTALSQQVGGMLQQVQSLANTQYGNQYVFSGISQAQPVTSGGAYNPAAASPPQQVEIGQGQQVATTVDGNQTFNTAPTTPPPNWSTYHPSQAATLLNVLSALQTDLQSGNAAAVEADLGALQAQEGNIGNVRAQLGVNMDRVQAALSQLTNLSTTLQSQQGNVENVDMAKILTQLAAQQNAYQAAVAAGANMKMPTLATYLP